MKNFFVWVIAFQLCYSEFVDFSDYHPNLVSLRNVPGFKNRNPSPEYNVVMRNLCDNWQSPISYLKERGYMPTDSSYKPKPHLEKKTEDTKNQLSKGENYFFFPENIQPRSERTLISSEENQKSSLEDSKIELPEIETSSLEASQNNTEGIVNKVKNKFLSIFSHKDKNNKNLLDESIDLEDPELFESYDDNEDSDRRLFARSVSEKPTISSNTSVLSNLTEPEIHFITNFIQWFKQYKGEFKFLLSSPTNSNTTTTKPMKTMSDEKSQNKTKPTAKDSEVKVNSSTQSPVSNTTTDCTEVVASTSFSKTPNNRTNEADAKNKTSSSSGKDVADDFTVDLDINQKNGTGQETHIKNKCICVPVPTTTPSGQNSTNKNKFIIKSKFLAHLHHMVDEVGKPPHKPLDLSKVQKIIDQSKHSTVTMLGGKTTQCTPLQLNDMSFDLEWNKINQLPVNSRDKQNILSFQPHEQSLAAKFLRETDLNSGKNNEYLKTPFSDNFLDSQQSLPFDLELPIKSSTKREVVLPSYGKTMDMSDVFPDNDGFDEYSDVNDVKESSKRRIKGRLKGRGRKKPKHKHNAPSEIVDINVTSLDSDPDVVENSNNFNNFDELKDIQFRVSDSDEEAISKFISNLNSPPEVFSFDVDKYLRSAKLEIEPKTMEFDYQTPEPRTYYEFIEPPAVENEQLPIIEVPIDSKMDPTINKRRTRKTDEKRDLLRQYIKGVSSALNHDLPELSESYKKIEDDDEKPQRSPNLNTDLTIRTNNLIDEFSTQLDAMDLIKSKDGDDSFSPNQVVFINDGIIIDDDTQKKNVDVAENDYSPQSLDIDLDLNKKFRDLTIGGGYDNPLPMKAANLRNYGESTDDIRQKETNDVEYI